MNESNGSIDFFDDDILTDPPLFVDDSPDDFDELLLTSQNSQVQVQEQSDFLTIGTNRKLKKDVPYDIHFLTGSVIFEKLIGFATQIDTDAVIQFTKKEVLFIVQDKGNTHAAIIRYSKNEFLEYDPGLIDENEDKNIFADISVIADEIVIKENYNIEMFVDTKINHRMYVICGKEKVESQLLSTEITGGSIEKSSITKYLSNKDLIGRLLNDTLYQRIIVNQIPFIEVIKSLDKKTKKHNKEKGKEIKPFASLHITRDELDFVLEDKVKSNSVVLSNEDLMAFPISEDTVYFNLRFLNKFGKLKLTFAVVMYICGTLPLIIETRFGGGKINLYYMIAPKVEEED